MNVEENKRLMQTLDDAWNGQDWETFNKRHAENVAVYWPGQPEPTRGQKAHQEEAEQFFNTFPDNRVGNRPYKALFGEGEWTCSVANFTGTMMGPMAGPDGKTIQPTNKKFQVEFCTVAHWNEEGEITEEKLFYDLVGLMRQLALM
ncbi:MAG TPA: ester cyclase [Candidatus Bathyarchaeia archaeon]|nr:ester cyclase [Candidatus Bathyarchaeia archaeon]